MNTFRMISRFSVVTIVVFAGNMGAYNFNAAPVLQRNQFTIGSTIVAEKICNKDEHAKKAFVETIGYSLDAKKDITPEEFAQHLVANWGIRRGSELLNSKGITVDAVVDQVVPKAVEDYVSPVVKTVAGAATHPETLTCAALYVFVNYILPNLPSK